MDMEIVTTKKKLSKSYISQMSVLGSKELIESTEFEVLGYVSGIIKHSNNSALIKINGAYKTLPLSWVKNGKSVTRPMPRHFRAFIDFTSEERCDIWWDKYQEIKAQCKNNQIYI